MQAAGRGSCAAALAANCLLTATGPGATMLPTMSEDMKARVEELYATLHAMPELGLKEVRTAAFLAEQLRTAGYAVETGVGGTGVVGVLRGEQPGPVLALRADMDALKHLIDGKECAIHSCGHDAHSAMVLCVAEQAAQAEARFRHAQDPVPAGGRNTPGGARPR